MNRLPFLYRIVFALAAVTYFSLGGPVPAAVAGPYELSGTYTFTDDKGAATSGTIDAKSSPGGPCSGTFADRFAGGSHTGTFTLNYGDGSSLTLSYEFAFDDTQGLFVGDYVITGGTGALTGVSGGGDIEVGTAVNGTGSLVLSGTLSH
jgi:hypothetical protein